MTAFDVYQDTLFHYPPALTSTGVTTSCLVVDKNNGAGLAFTFQVTVANIGTSVVVRFEGSVDGTNFFAFASDTTITANGTTAYNISNFPVKLIRARLVTINTGTPTVTFSFAAK